MCSVHSWGKEPKLKINFEPTSIFQDEQNFAQHDQRKVAHRKSFCARVRLAHTHSNICIESLSSQILTKNEQTFEVVNSIWGVFWLASLTLLFSWTIHVHEQSNPMEKNASGNDFWWPRWTKLSYLSVLFSRVGYSLTIERNQLDLASYCTSAVCTVQNSSMVFKLAKCYWMTFERKIPKFALSPNVPNSVSSRTIWTANRVESMIPN